MLNQLFLSVLEVSLTASIVILAVKLLSFFINKNYAAKWKKLIWLIIAVRLLIPFNPALISAPIQLNLPDSNIADNISHTTPIDKNTAPANEVPADGLTETVIDTGTQGGESAAQAGENLNSALPWAGIAVILWGAGCIIFILYHLIGYLHFRKQVLRWSRVVKEQRIHNIISDISAQFGLKKQPAVYICDKAASPSLMGFIHPVLLIPSDCYSDKELALILKHELTHYRQYDLWYKLFLLVVNAVHWFNPAVYLLRCEACIDLELSCDDEVIKGMSAEDRIIYGETILSCVSQQKMRKAALTTCFNDTAKTLKGRLKNILSAGKKRNGLIIIFISLIFIAGIGALVTFTGGGQKQKNADGFTWYGAVDLISEETKLPDNLIEGYDAWNEFLNSDSTIALVAAIPEEDIYVYGLKENGAEEGTYTLRGICVRQGEELQVLDTGWGVYDEIPKLQYEDYDGDGIKELAMISRSSGGTNLFFNDLHILEKNSTGGWTDNTFDSSDWQYIINNRLEYQVKDGSLTIAIAGQDTGYNIDIAALEEEWGEKLTSVFFGNFGEFTFNNGKIYLQVLPAAVVGDWATPQAITETYIRMEVLYNGKFDLQNAFAPGPATQEASEDSPEDEAGTETEDNPDEEAGTETEDNPNMETLDSPEDEAGTETEDNPNMETLDSPVGRLNQEMTDSFVKAYFSGDRESAEKYMAENAEYDSYVYKDASGNEADVYDKLTHLLAKWYAASEEEAKVQYEYALEGEDSYTYLDLELKQEEGGWVITAIVLEK